MLEPIKDSVIFVFHDSIRKGRFEEQTTSGIYLGLDTAAERDAKAPRWGSVVAVGPDVNPQIRAGSKVLIEAGQWTFGMTYDGVKIWRTSEPNILCLGD